MARGHVAKIVHNATHQMTLLSYTPAKDCPHQRGTGEIAKQSPIVQVLVVPLVSSSGVCCGKRG